MNVIILYQHLVREWDASQRLRALYEEAGDNAIVCSIDFERVKAYKYAKKNIPDVILVPFFVDHEHEEWLSAFIDLNRDVKIINLHQEQIGSKFSVGLMLPRTPFTKNGSFHFAWGEYFKALLLSCGVKEENIIITGNSRNDFRNITHTDKKELASHYGLSPSKKWILFAENRGWYLGRNKEYTKRTLAPRGMTDEHFYRAVREEKENLDAFADQMRLLTEEFGREYEFIYRPHPGTVLHYELPKWVHIIADRPIYDWIACCDLFLTCESTSIFEAEMMGKPCAFVPSINIPDDDNKMAGVWDYPRLDRITEITDSLIEHIRSENESRGTIYTRYLGEVDGNAASRIVAASRAVRDIAVDEADKVYSHATPKQLLRQFLYEKATWVTTKTGLLDRLKFPSSAYAEKRDIPYSPENAWISRITYNGGGGQLRFRLKPRVYISRQYFETSASSLAA